MCLGARCDRNVSDVRLMRLKKPAIEIIKNDALIVTKGALLFSQPASGAKCGIHESGKSREMGESHRNIKNSRGRHMLGKCKKDAGKYAVARCKRRWKVEKGKRK